MTDHPFQPGVKVAVPVRGYNACPNSYVEGVVEKAYKNGRFILKDDRQRTQWRAWPPGDRPDAYDWTRNVWHATGRGSFLDRLVLIEPATEAKIAEANEARRQYDRFTKVSNSVYRLPRDRMTPEALDLFEKALAAMKPEAK